MSYLEDECFVIKYMAHCSLVKIIESSNYNYVVPDFKNKYVFFDASYRLGLTDEIITICEKGNGDALLNYQMGLCAYDIILDYRNRRADKSSIVRIKEMFGKNLSSVETISRIDKTLLTYAPVFLSHVFFKFRYCLIKS